MDLSLIVGYGTPNKHAQDQMKDLGIAYKKAVPQGIYDCWWFFGCEGVDVDNLPNHIDVRDFGDLSRLVGYGLSKGDVLELQGFYNEPEVKEVVVNSKPSKLYNPEDVVLFLELNGVKHKLEGFNLDN